MPRFPGGPWFKPSFIQQWFIIESDFPQTIPTGKHTVLTLHKKLRKEDFSFTFFRLQKWRLVKREQLFIAAITQMITWTSLIHQQSIAVFKTTKLYKIWSVMKMCLGKSINKIWSKSDKNNIYKWTKKAWTLQVLCVCLQMKRVELFI